MKKIKLLLASLLLTCFSASAQTNVSGGIYVNTTWTLANSPYIMTGSIVVFPGVVLTIEPGVEVRVKVNNQNQSLYYLETRGTINMIGQPGALITFKTDSTPNKVSAWSGFSVKNSQGGAINYDYVSISNANEPFTYDAGGPANLNLHQCEFKYNGQAITSNSQLKADQCIFKGNHAAVFGYGTYEFTQCLFDSNYTAMLLYPSDLKIDSCTFIRNYNYGLTLGVLTAQGTSIKNSTFSYNKTAIYTANNGVIDNCKFLFNDDALNNTQYLMVKNSLFENNGNAILANVATTVNNCDINFNNVGVAIVGVTFSQPIPVIENNRICSNTNYNIDNQTDLNLFIPTNCFCESDSTVIESKILDGYDDITKGLISYAIFDTTCTNVLKIVNKAPGVTAITENEVGAIKLFPNPASDNLNITYEGKFISLEIYNTTGQLQSKANLSNEPNTIDISHLKPSMYYSNFIDSNFNTKTIRFRKL
jgi:hypothetical protein